MVSPHEVNLAVAKAIGWEVQEQDEGHLAAWPMGNRSKAECPWSPAADPGDALASLEEWCKAKGESYVVKGNGHTASVQIYRKSALCGSGDNFALAACQCILAAYAHEVSCQTIIHAEAGK